MQQNDLKKVKRLNIIFSGLKELDVSQFERSVDKRIVEAPEETLRNSGMNVSAVAVRK